ncbi:Ubx2p [Kluyveromyces lactis]|uniref:KLLA0B01001p n=1 Tax=Kluyveromyces lactis (strain ATCC 8585 / CBS 2359 / DSM 70799 / NBRC 1267 / NRRL Y-1140 / WM37) TaxID=284590 RepID=Q6CWW4_KLULA|nr:uncharacterized protein KLLA0_B01001g [Kluyveromyces lactis]CAH01968.1 KLLA0B01001p [Kluyveromyces lactis]|eukprot:XP_451575.1 uncharacterized protein KLLA0_B01001g [Kluyveromyces lactis]
MPVIEHNDQRFELSHSEEQKLNEFQMITSFPTDELPNVIKLLRNHSWQLEHALGRYFDDNWKENLDFAPQPTPAQNTIPVQQSQSDERQILEDTRSELPISLRIPNILENPFGMVPKLPFIHRLPYNYKEKFQIIGLNGQPNATDVYSRNSVLLAVLFLPNLIVRLSVHMFSWLGILISYALGQNMAKSKASYNWVIPQKPQVDRKPEDTFADIRETCGENAEELLSLCSMKSYNEIFDECESKYKFMLLLFLGPITGEEEKICHSSKTFLTHFLSHPSTIALFKTHSDNLEIYIRTVQDPECWALAKQLKLKYTLECLLVANVHNRLNSTSGSRKMSVLSALKVKSLARFQDSFKSAIRRYSPELIASQTEMQELEMVRKMKEMQDEAYHESLKLDTEKQLERERQEESLKQKLISEAQQKEILKIKDLFYQFTMLLHSLKSGSNAEVKPTEKISNIQFRTSDGKRIVKKFSGSNTLRDVYIDIAAHLYLTSSDQYIEGNNLDTISEILINISENPEYATAIESTNIAGELLESKTENQLKAILEKGISELRSKTELEDISFDFELVSPFPRKQTPNDPSIQLKTRSELWPNGSLLIESLDNDDSSEGEDESDDAGHST